MTAAFFFFQSQSWNLSAWLFVPVQLSLLSKDTHSPAFLVSPSKAVIFSSEASLISGKPLSTVVHGLRAITFAHCHLTWRCIKRNAILFKGLSQISGYLMTLPQASFAFSFENLLNLCQFTLAFLAFSHPGVLLPFTVPSTKKGWASHLGEVFLALSSGHAHLSQKKR